MLSVGGFLFLAAALCLVGLALASAMDWIAFHWPYLLTIPALFLLGIVCRVTAGALASKRNFRYNYEADEATWGDDPPQRLTHAEWERDYRASSG